MGLGMDAGSLRILIYFLIKLDRGRSPFSDIFLTDLASELLEGS